MALFLLLLAGCGDRGRSVVAPPTHGDVNELFAWVSATPATFRAGETVVIEIGIRNPTTRPIVVGFTSGSCALSYVVLTGDGTSRVSGLDGVCTADAPTYELAPGETIVGRHEWDGTTYEGSPLPAGEYLVDNAGFLAPPVQPARIQILVP